MQIYGPFRVSTPQATGNANRSTGLQPKQPVQRSSTTQVDQLDLSNGTSSVNRLASSGSDEIRVDRVAEIRRQIAGGSYDTPEKLDAALDRFLDQYA